ncbi:LysR family transcriptional regulator [Pseudoalteromonas mariniglutinosa]|uniref:LysR family transcriptional regulator n=1 Tax=Pseudoalteromonas mariniglutinosa TaxID=206042 RepID=UPI00384D61C1
MSRWQGIDEFLAVAETGSFTKASKLLGMSVAHVSRYVSQLEKRLNTQLLTRTTRNVVLTKEGEIFAHQTKQLQHAMDDARQLLAERQNSPKGTIKLTAPVMYGENYIMPAVHHFMQSHPDIEVISHLSNEQVNLLDEGYDLAIRLGHLKDSSLKARRLSERRLVMCCSKAYLDQFGQPHSISELHQHVCLIGNSSYWRVKEQGKEKHIKVTGRLQCNSGWALVDAALKGLGIVQLPDYYVNKYIQSGELLVVLPAVAPATEGVWGVYPPRQFVATNVRALLDHLAASFQVSDL